LIPNIKLLFEFSEKIPEKNQAKQLSQTAVSNSVLNLFYRHKNEHSEKRDTLANKLLFSFPKAKKFASTKMNITQKRDQITSKLF
jgi:hypothetical protein